MRIVYIVLQEDTKIDTRATVFDDRDTAIEWAKEQAQKKADERWNNNGHYPTEMTDSDLEYCAEYKEGGWFSVVAAGVVDKSNPGPKPEGHPF